MCPCQVSLTQATSALCVPDTSTLLEWMAQIPLALCVPDDTSTLLEWMFQVPLALCVPVKCP